VRAIAQVVPDAVSQVRMAHAIARRIFGVALVELHEHRRGERGRLVIAVHERPSLVERVGRIACRASHHPRAVTDPVTLEQLSCLDAHGSFLSRRRPIF